PSSSSWDGPWWLRADGVAPSDDRPGGFPRVADGEGTLSGSDRSSDDLVAPHANQTEHYLLWKRLVGGEADGAIGDGVTVEIVGQGCHHFGTEREDRDVVLGDPESEQGLSVHQESRHAVAPPLDSVRCCSAGDVGDPLECVPHRVLEPVQVVADGAHRGILWASSGYVACDPRRRGHDGVDE